MGTKNAGDTSAWTETIEVNGTNITFKMDTGAEVNLLSKKLLSRLKCMPEIKSSNVRLFSYSGHAIKTYGKCVLRCTLNKKVRNLEFFITDQLEPIIGIKAIKQFELVPNLYAVSTDMSANRVIDSYSDVFREGSVIQCTPYHMTLKDDAVPTVASTRQVPLSIRKELMQELDRLVQDNILEPVSEPTDWVHPIVIVKKPSGGLRICIDPWPLNKYLKRKHYILPVEGVLGELNDAKIFTVLDASRAFLQIPLDTYSSKLCTITTPFGRYKYKTMPYGISSAPEVFQKLVNVIYDGLEGVIPYMDDIQNYAQGQQEQ